MSEGNAIMIEGVNVTERQSVRLSERIINIKTEENQLGEQSHGEIDQIELNDRINQIII